MKATSHLNGLAPWREITAASPTYFAYSNVHRLHSALDDAPPASRLPMAV
jgi:hypothetical protein